jgi:hypothetical protein
MACRRHLASGFSFEAGSKFEKLGAEVIQRIDFIIQRAIFGHRIVAVVKCAAHAPCNIKAARGTNHTNRIQPVRILQYLCLKRARLYIGRKAVCLDRMGGGSNTFFIPSELTQEIGRFFSGQS